MAAAPPPSARVAAQAPSCLVGRRGGAARDARATPGEARRCLPRRRLARAEAAVGRLGRAQHDNLGALRALAQENAELRKTSERQRRALKRMQAVEDDAAAARARLRRTEAARAETGKQLDDAKHALAQCRAENQRLRTAVAAGKPGTWGV